MPRQIGPIGPAAPAALLIAFAVTILPGGPARAADDCIAAPKSQPPQGSHWYYRVDRVKQRKCWYLAPEGLKVSAARPAPPQARPAAQPPAPLAAESDARSTLPTPAEPETTEIWPPIAASDAIQAGVSAVPWPDAPTAASPIAREETVPSAPAAPEQATTGAQDADETTAQRPIAAADATADAAVAPLRMFLFVAGALAVSGLLLRAMFKITATRRRQLYVDRRGTDWSASGAHEQMFPNFHRTIARARGPIEANDPYGDMEESLGQGVRGRERQAA